jgi:hypothetical protein
VELAFLEALFDFGKMREQLFELDGPELESGDIRTGGRLKFLTNRYAGVRPAAKFDLGYKHMASRWMDVS